MQLLFLDVSGQLVKRRFFALGGVALRERDWHLLRDLWQTTLATHSWPVEKEVKWHGIRTGEVPPTLADAIIAALSRSPLRCYVTLLDIELGTRIVADRSLPLVTPGTQPDGRRTVTVSPSGWTRLEKLILGQTRRMFRHLERHFPD